MKNRQEGIVTVSGGREVTVSTYLRLGVKKVGIP
jgi:hypothetical protein